MLKFATMLSSPDLTIHHPESSCQPWRVSQVPGVGRILMATRDIHPWELVVEDRALVIVPDNHPVCLGCLGPVDGRFSCGGCGWPVCTAACAQKEQHRVECAIFQNKKAIATVKDYSKRHSMYTCVAVLKLLLLKGVDGQGSQEWNQVMQLMSHWTTRKKELEVAEAIRRMMVFFVERLGLEWVQLEDVQHAFGVLKTNAFGYLNHAARVLYPLISLLSHSCSSNLEPISEPGMRIALRAKRLIKEGEELSIRYTCFLEPGANIRIKLKSEWMFGCRCIRCSDPTEFGSFFSSPKCPCGDGFLVQESCIGKICTGCHEDKDIGKQMDWDEEVEQRLKDADLEDIQQLNREVRTGMGFHSNYHTVFKVGKRFMELGQKTKEPEILSDIVEAGGNVMEVLRLLDRGCSAIKGRFMLLHVSSQQRLMSAKKEMGQLDGEDCQSIVKELNMMRMQALKMVSPYTKKR